MRLGPSPVAQRFSTAITETSGGVSATKLGMNLLLVGDMLWLPIRILDDEVFDAWPCF